MEKVTGSSPVGSTIVRQGCGWQAFIRETREKAQKLRSGVAHGRHGGHERIDPRRNRTGVVHGTRGRTRNRSSEKSNRTAASEQALPLRSSLEKGSRIFVRARPAEPAWGGRWIATSRLRAGAPRNDRGGWNGASRGSLSSQSRALSLFICVHLWLKRIWDRALRSGVGPRKTRRTRKNRSPEKSNRTAASKQALPLRSSWRRSRRIVITRPAEPAWGARWIATSRLRAGAPRNDRGGDLRPLVSICG
jgi:hypothetical protein